MSLYDSEGTLPGDFNADGRTDLLQRNGWILDGENFEFEEDISVFLSSDYPIRYIGDFDGDGYDDILQIKTETYWYNWTQYRKYSFKITKHYKNGTGYDWWEFNISKTITTLKSADEIEFDFGDFNGDGKTDILAKRTYSNNSSDIYLYTYNGNLHEIAAMPSFTNVDKIKIADFNGSGKSDIMILIDDQYVVYEYEKDKSSIQELFSGSIPIEASDYGIQIYTGEFNGDGKSDILFTSIDNTFIIEYCTGTNFTTNCYTVPVHFAYKIKIADYNGDGIDDIANMFSVDGNMEIRINYFKYRETPTIETETYIVYHKGIETSNSIQNYLCNFNPETGNLTNRTTNNIFESFGYDNLNRLTNVYDTKDIIANMLYYDNGNFDEKSDAGTFHYDDVDHVHAVTSITEAQQTIPTQTQNIIYTDFNKVETISENDYKLQFTYNSAQARKKTELYKLDATTKMPRLLKTKYFFGTYEKEITPEGTRELNYVPTPDGIAAVFIKENNNEGEMFYLHKDHLGSITQITDDTGELVQSIYYNAWGVREIVEDPLSLGEFFLDRGYTGHEHLALFSIINMNGRVYDPILGRFLSPDNYIQAAGFTQSFNRYSYALNNPFKYTDPDGNNPVLLGMLAYGLINGYMTQQAGGSFARGFAVGMITAGVAMALTAGVGMIGQGATTGFIPGAITGAMVGGVSGGLTQLIAYRILNNVWSGTQFLNGAISGSISGAITGGAIGYSRAEKYGVNPWTGGVTKEQRELFGLAKKGYYNHAVRFMHPEKYKAAGDPEIKLGFSEGAYGHTVPIDNQGNKLDIVEASSIKGGVRSKIYMHPGSFESAQEFVFTSYHELSHAELFYNGSMHQQYIMFQHRGSYYAKDFYFIDGYTRENLYFYTEYYALNQEASIGSWRGYNRANHLYKNRWIPFLANPTSPDINTNYDFVY